MSVWSCEYLYHCSHISPLILLLISAFDTFNERRSQIITPSKEYAFSHEEWFYWRIRHLSFSYIFHEGNASSLQTPHGKSILHFCHSSLFARISLQMWTLYSTYLHHSCQNSGWPKSVTQNFGNILAVSFEICFAPIHPSKLSIQATICGTTWLIFDFDVESTKAFSSLAQTLISIIGISFTSGQFVRANMW